MGEWTAPTELPDLRRAGVIALDLETRDGGLAEGKGSAWPWGDGHVCGVSVAWLEGKPTSAMYVPVRHPSTDCLDRGRVIEWLRDLLASDVRVVTQNGLYDFGWLWGDFGLRMPPPERLEEIGALATIIDENRYTYNLDDLCAWRGLPGKDDSALRQDVSALVGTRKKRVDPRQHLWQLPARCVGPYAEADAAATLALWRDLDPVLDEEGTRDAYRLEVDLLPMVHAMRRRGIRIDEVAASFAYEEIAQRRDEMLSELSERLGEPVGMEEIGRTKWLAQTFDALGIKYPRTAKGNPSFTAGNTGWMPRHPHWLPGMIVQADKYDCAAEKFLKTYVLGHVKRGRIHAEVHPHRSDEGGTRSLRFSYSSPPLQQMTAHDEELAPLIRGVFLPEEGEAWAKPDVSQQEYRFIVHYAEQRSLARAREAGDRYRADPKTDFHRLVVDWTGLQRQHAKNTNFAKSFGAGVPKFALMIEKPVEEAQRIYNLYDRELPFVSQLNAQCQAEAARDGYTALYDGARRHWDLWEPVTRSFSSGPEFAPVGRVEADRRAADPHHPWYRLKLRRGDTRKAMNGLIQGSAARHTKLAMRAIFREGIIPLLQMHDSVDCSVKCAAEGELVARLMEEAVKLTVPIVVDLRYGRSWGDAKHEWQALDFHATASSVTIEGVSANA